MPHGDIRRAREENLRLGAAMAEVEGTYSALLRANGLDGHQRLRDDLASASRRLAELAALPPNQRPPTPVARRSRWQRRRLLAERGAAWIVARFGQDKQGKAH